MKQMAQFQFHFLFFFSPSFFHCSLFLRCAKYFREMKLLTGFMNRLSMTNTRGINTNFHDGFAKLLFSIEFVMNLIGIKGFSEYKLQGNS